MRIMTFYAILFSIMLLKIYLSNCSLWLCSVECMTRPAEFPPRWPENVASFDTGYMLLTRAMTCFTTYLTMNILCLQIFDILMTFKAGFLSGIMDFSLFEISQGICPVMTILSKAGRCEKMPRHQKKYYKYRKCQ